MQFQNAFTTLLFYGCSARSFCYCVLLRIIIRVLLLIYFSIDFFVARLAVRCSFVCLHIFVHSFVPLFLNSGFFLIPFFIHIWIKMKHHEFMYLFIVFHLFLIHLCSDEHVFNLSTHFPSFFSS